MSSELYDKYARINHIDQAIYESEQKMANGAGAIDAGAKTVYVVTIQYQGRNL